MKQHYIRNKDKLLKKINLYRLNNLSKIVERKRVYYIQNKEFICNKRKIYYENNKDKCLTLVLKRRELKQLLNENISNEFLQKIRKKFFNKCFNCESTKSLCIDHHKPLSKGYALDETNAVLLCKSCNSRKSAKDPLEFYSKEKIKELEITYNVKCTEDK